MELASELPWSFHTHLPETIGQLRKHCKKTSLLSLQRGEEVQGDARQQTDIDQNKSCSRIKEKLSLMPTDMDFCNLCALMGSRGLQKGSSAVVLL